MINKTFLTCVDWQTKTNLKEYWYRLIMANHENKIMANNKQQIQLKFS